MTTGGGAVRGKPADGAASGGRAALAGELGRLQVALTGLGRTQKAAVAEANRRLRRGGGRPEDRPWPRRDGGRDLSVQAVNDWFPKQRSVKEPSVPQDFADLWALVEVMLEWTGQLPAGAGADRLRANWATLHRGAQAAQGLDEQVRAYLDAVRRAADTHPYPGVPGSMRPPSLTEVYVRQRSRRAQREGQSGRDGQTGREGQTGRDGQTGREGQRPDGPSTEGAGAGLAAAIEPADAVFRAADRVSVLVGGPGCGKSTLLHTRWRTAAEAWLDRGAQPARGGEAVPVLVSARALAGEGTPVAVALAEATRNLSRYGRHPEVLARTFLERPSTGAHWQLLVDGLDELPNASERRAVLEKVANAVAGEPLLYRCVVATRPLSEHELDVLDEALGRPAPHYELQDFTSEDLTGYIRRFFATKWPQHEATRRADQFADALRGASLLDLAQTPLMALMLCQLHLTAPDRPLPRGRSAVYDQFTSLVYEDNEFKGVRDSHEAAIESLAGGIQSVRGRTEAVEAARRVHDALPELIDFLAHQRLTGQEGAATELLAAHPAVLRPARVHPFRWDAFLADLLGHTGLLVHSADGLGFPHQTFLEFHAARHATRDESSRAETVRVLFAARDSAGRWNPPELDGSYTGFLLDRIFDSDDQAAAGHAWLRHLADRGEDDAAYFLSAQVEFRTTLPEEACAGLLARFARDARLTGYARVSSARALTALGAHAEQGAALLAGLATEPGLHGYQRIWAVEALAAVEGYLARAVDFFRAMSEDRAADGDDRVAAARSLAGLEGCRSEGAALLGGFASGADLDGDDRIAAAAALAEVDGYEVEAAALLTGFADSRALPAGARARAAEHLSRLDGQAEAGARRLGLLAGDGEAPASDRVDAAEALAELPGHADEGAAILASFVADSARPVADRLAAGEAMARPPVKAGAAPLLAGLAEDLRLGTDQRISAAEALARLDGGADRATDVLTAFVRDADLHGGGRIGAARALARVDGHAAAAAAMLAALAGDTSLAPGHRRSAAEALAQVEGQAEQAGVVLDRIADDTRIPAHGRVALAATLAGVAGFAEVGAGVLITLGGDATIDHHERVSAARELAGVAGFAGQGADLLTALATDPALDHDKRVAAATALAGVVGFAGQGAGLLAALAGDPAADHHERVSAARELAGVAGFVGQGADLLTALAGDAAVDHIDRAGAANALVGIEGFAEVGAAALAALTRNVSVDLADRVSTAKDLAGIAGFADQGADLLAALAVDTAADGYERVSAASGLAETEGFQRQGADLLAALGHDTALDHDDRLRAAKDLAEVAGFAEPGARLLAALARDTTVDGWLRVWAAKDLAEVAGFADEGAGLLAAFARDTTFDGGDRVSAAEGLGEVAGFARQAAGLLGRLAQDTTLAGGDRVSAAHELAELAGFAEHGVALLNALARDTTLDARRRRVAREHLAGAEKTGGAPEAALTVEPQVRPAVGADREAVAGVLRTSWGGTSIVVHGTAYDALELPALVAEQAGRVVGVLTYTPEGDGWEVVSLDAVVPRAGIGSALLGSAVEAARRAGARRLWLVTTNDNLDALRFYQRRGMRITGVAAGAVDAARILKPAIPGTGGYGIPLHDELTLELHL